MSYLMSSLFGGDFSALRTVCEGFLFALGWYPAYSITEYLAHKVKSLFEK